MTASTAYAISHATPTRADATIAPADGRTSSHTATAAPATARTTVRAAWPGASPRYKTVITTASAVATTQITAITRLRVTGRSSIVMMHASYIRLALKRSGGRYSSWSPRQAFFLL